jgi:hypothetical protein
MLKFENVFLPQYAFGRKPKCMVILSIEPFPKLRNSLHLGQENEG